MSLDYRFNAFPLLVYVPKKPCMKEKMEMQMEM